MLHEQIGIERGVITTIHDVTNTQVIVDAPHKDLRRARSALNSLIPTSTGSATAITMIYPELDRQAQRHRRSGAAAQRLADRRRVHDGTRRHRRARSTTCSATRPTVSWTGILGFEDRPLVSADYTNDTRSGIVDGPSTMVVDGRMVKVLIWYDNEYGYAFRMADLAAKVAAQRRPGA